MSYAYQKYRPVFTISLIGDKIALGGKKAPYTSVRAFKDVEILNTDNAFYFSKLPLLRQLEEERRIFINRAFDLSLIYPLRIRSRWSLLWANSLQWGLSLLSDEDKIFPFLFYQSASWSSYVQHEGKLKYEFVRRYANAYSFYQKRSLELSYDVMAQSHSAYLNGKIKAYWNAEFGKEWFLALNGIFKTRLWSKKPQTSLLKTSEKGISSYIELKQAIEDIFQLDFQALKVVNQSYYPLKLPFSIRRWAPLAGLSFLSFKPAGVKSLSFLTPFVGAEWEINFILENFILKLGLSGGYIVNLSTPSQPPAFKWNISLTGSL